MSVSGILGNLSLLSCHLGDSDIVSFLLDFSDSSGIFSMFVYSMMAVSSLSSFSGSGIVLVSVFELVIVPAPIQIVRA